MIYDIAVVEWDTSGRDPGFKELIPYNDTASDWLIDNIRETAWRSADYSCW